MPSLPLQNLADYTIVDDWVQRADEFVQGTPYWVLILITAFLFVIFIYGLVKARRVHDRRCCPHRRDLRHLVRRGSYVVELAANGEFHQSQKTPVVCALLP